MANKMKNKAKLINPPENFFDHIEIRDMKPEEAIDITHLIYQCYGDTYFYKDFYIPEHIAKLNAQGVIKSLVAVNETNEIVGHMTLFINDTIGNVATSGAKEDCKLGEPSMSMVRPDYRNRGILTRMINRILNEDPSFTKKLIGLFCPPISEHVYSQSALYRFGFKDCGCLAGYYPSVEIKDITNTQIQRLSLILTYYSLKNERSKIIYPPNHHKQIIINIYNNLDLVPHLEKPQDNYNIGRYMKKPSLIKAKIVPMLNNASIKVIQYGVDIIECVKKETQKMLAQNTQSILLYLSLNDPLTYKFTEQFEDLGFFFAGILPNLSIGDALILQYLKTNHFDYNHIHIISKKAEEILNYVKQCDQAKKHQLMLIV